ncbi:MAG: hypothetical protein LBK98_01965 [Peptococcaceae bacterium]|jgi:shikimate 5-dehydrogenase/shikimate kinase|nr:hypothetical protein [Peptococcaceae bacterium]
MRNIVLIGLPGSGKSTLGALAAASAGLGFVDLDEEAVKQAGMPIKDIFRQWGEAGFRRLESQIAAAAARGQKTVIATGGGVVLREENLRRLRENGLVIFLDRPPELIAEAIDSGARPLLAGDARRLFPLAAERRPLYLSGADAVLTNVADQATALRRLLALIRSVYPGDGFAVIGDPIGHTLSPAIHGAVFAQIGWAAAYDPIHVPRGRLGEFVAAAKSAGLRGFNVTVPHKQAIIPFLDGVDQAAALCGAVNTVALREGEYWGYNTDMDGLAQALEQAGAGFAGRRVMILGAGGAASAAALKAVMAGAAGVRILARRLEQAAAAAERVNRATRGPGTGTGMGAGPESSYVPGPAVRATAESRTASSTRAAANSAAPSPAGTASSSAAAGPGAGVATAPSPGLAVWAGMTPADLATAAAAADILINATPLGLAGGGWDFPDLSFLRALPVDSLVCDLIYNPPQTRLLREAAALGRRAVNGLGMLIWQALLADELFCGRPLDKPALSRQVAAALELLGLIPDQNDSPNPEERRESP